MVGEPAITALLDAIAEASMQRLTDVQQEMEQEPFAWMILNSLGDDEGITYYQPSGDLLPGWSYKPIYTHPPRREWVGLTDEEIRGEADIGTYVAITFADKTKGIALDRVTVCDFARAIESKLKEKNS
jgi:hypothetical protein